MCLDGFEGSSSPRYGFTDPISEGAVMFEAPELPEETLMEVNMCVWNLLLKVWIIKWVADSKWVVGVVMPIQSFPDNTVKLVKE